jgi:hypothetical protein
MGEKAAAAAQARRDAQAKVEAAQAEIDRLEAELREAGKRNRQSLVEPADDLRPGDPWGAIPLGIRVLTLKANMVDLMDRSTQTLLSQQVGPVAREAARRWLEFMPAGGQVHLTEAGHAAGVAAGRYVYLGRLDP